MKTTIFPTLEETLYLHEELIRLFGGDVGIRDQGLLESALYRPQSGYYKTISLQAAALIQSVALNHCFVDGNKRVAFALTAIFLKINGWNLEVKANEGERFIVEDLIQGKQEVELIANWIEAHLKKG